MLHFIKLVAIPVEDSFPFMKKKKWQLRRPSFCLFTSPGSFSCENWCAPFEQVLSYCLSWLCCQCLSEKFSSAFINFGRKSNVNSRHLGPYTYHLSSLPCTWSSIGLDVNRHFFSCSDGVETFLEAMGGLFLGLCSSRQQNLLILVYNTLKNGGWDGWDYGVINKGETETKWKNGERERDFH